MSFPSHNNDTRGKRPANPTVSPGSSRASSRLSSRPTSSPQPIWRSSDSTLISCVSRGSGASALKIDAMELDHLSPPHGLSAKDINELLDEYVPAKVLTAKRLDRGDTRFSSTAEPLRAIDEGSGSERGSSRGNDTANAARTERPTTGGPCEGQYRSFSDQEAYPRGAQETSASRHATPKPVHGNNPGWTEPPTTRGHHDDHANLINQESRPPGKQHSQARRNGPDRQANTERTGTAIAHVASSLLDRPRKRRMKAVFVATVYVVAGGIAMGIRIGAGIVPPTNEHNERIIDILDFASNTVTCLAPWVCAIQEGIKNKGAFQPFMFWASVIIGVVVPLVIGTNWGLCFRWRTPRGRNFNNHSSHATDYVFLLATAFSIVCAAFDEKTPRDEESAADQLADN